MREKERPEEQQQNPCEDADSACTAGDTLTCSSRVTEETTLAHPPPTGREQGNTQSPGYTQVEVTRLSVTSERTKAISKEEDELPSEGRGDGTTKGRERENRAMELLSKLTPVVVA